ncbi:MAG: ATP-binding protein [Nanoarchaeota archaeon]|nr:ATP-binding protein [Nanoarchaeota archaeon]
MLDLKTPIVIGRGEHDLKKYGKLGCIYIGNKYQEIDAYKTSLANPVYMDVAGSHVVSIFGKRGGGKSYTMGVIAEGFSLLDEKIRQNTSIILIDTMGVYWTMRKPNSEQERELVDWGLKPQGVDVKIFTPYRFYEEYKKKGIPTDYPFSIKASTLDSDDWLEAFKQPKFSALGVLINDVVSGLKEKGKEYTVNDIIEAVKANKEFNHDETMEVVAMFKLAESWGIFSDTSTELKVLAAPGKISVLDVSCYATLPSGWEVKTMVLGLVAKHLFISRMLARKQEELDNIKDDDAWLKKDHHILNNPKKAEKMPLVWLVIDEAHEFLPRDEKDKNAATEPLKIIMREGRQPGISLILATQQPGKIHTDVMTQSDTVLSHRVTADIDIQALMLLAQSYNRDGIMEAMEDLPRLKGTAIIFDDANEQIHEIKIRPRISWHGGGSPNALNM